MGLEQCAGSQTIKKPEKLLIEYLASDSWSRQNVASIGVMSYSADMWQRLVRRAFYRSSYLRNRRQGIKTLGQNNFEQLT